MLHMHEAIKKIIHKIGKEPLCNGKAERAPHIFGKCFILCWRCTSLICSMLLCSCLSCCFQGTMYIELEMHGVIYAGILVIPTLVDGVLQYAFHIESTNVRRTVFGGISGIGLWMLASWVDTYFLPGIKEILRQGFLISFCIPAHNTLLSFPFHAA